MWRETLHSQSNGYLKRASLPSKWWYRIKRENPGLRKSLSLAKQVPRGIARVSRSQPPFAVLANSFPKSGTHLLVQVLEGLPQIANYDSFIAQYPPIRFHKRSDRTIARRISQIAPGELVSGHLHFSPNYLDQLSQRRCVSFFIYRDLRDVVASEAHYLTHMNPWHRVHRYFVNHLNTTDERLSAAIEGIPEDQVPYQFGDVRSRFEPFLGWLDRPDVFAIKYEDLNGLRQTEVIRDMIAFFGQRTQLGCDVDQVYEDVIASINPARSRTFRAGRSGGWRDVFNADHIGAMKRIAGDLLIRLGYEDDYSW